MTTLSIPTSFKRKLFLINHQTLNRTQHFHEAGFSKCLAMQTLRDFKTAGYNDSVTGEVFEDEAMAKARLKKDEYYLEIEVEAEAISYRMQDGSVYLNRGYVPTLKALKTSTGEKYRYDELLGFQREVKPKMTVNSSIIYGYNPSVWDLRALERERN